MMRALAFAGVTLAAFLACAPPRPSVDVSLPLPAPGVVWIRDVAILDVETGVRTLGRDVRLRGGEIEAIIPAGHHIEPDAPVSVDGSGATLVPGLIDMHGHVQAEPAPTWDRGFPDPEANLRAFLYAGITTIFDPADESGDAFTRRERVARGELVGPRVLASGPSLTDPNGHPIALVREFAPAWIAWYFAPRAAIGVSSAIEIDSHVERLAGEGADFIKIVVDRIPLDSGRLTRELAAAAVESAERRGLRVVAHIGTTQDAIDAAEAGVAAWMHGVYKERIPDDQIAVLAGYGIPMVPTIEVFDRYARAGEAPWEATSLESEMVPRALLDSFYPTPEDFDTGALTSWLELRREVRSTSYDNVRRLRDAGVTILAGSDCQSGVFPGPGLHRELGQLVRAGLTPAEAIRAATLDAARFIASDPDPDFGSVAIGKRADLLLVDGDPSVDVGALQRIREVFLAGVPVERVPMDEGPG